ncbi:GTP-binding protein, partial [Brevibacterium sp. UMB10442]|nr:GTP-binding protein [Brevibacterium sp. UMB10442]
IAAIEGEETHDHGHKDDDHDEQHHNHENNHHHGHHHHHHGIENEESGEALEYNIQTFVYYARPALDINFFDDFVARKWPKEIIRCKGLCYFASEPDICYVFEQAGR